LPVFENTVNACGNGMAHGVAPAPRQNIDEG